MEQVNTNNPKDIKNDDNIENYLQSCRNENVSYLTDEIIFKIVAICLMSISKLKSKESTEVHGVIAITLAILSQLVQFAINRIQKSFIEVPKGLTEVTNSKPCSVEEDDKKKVVNNLEVAGGVYEEKRKEKIGNAYKGKEEPTNDVNNIDKNLNNNVKENTESNGNAAYQSTKRTSDKTKSLLTKLRRRKRRNSSDSEGSDINQMNVGSSSDEANSDISETEEDDILSEGNILSDDALSDDLTDEEGISKETKIDTVVEVKSNEQLNGDNGIDKNTKNHAEAVVVLQNGGASGHLQNGRNVKGDDKKDLQSTNNKESIENTKGSTATVTTNIDCSNALLDGSGGSTNTVTHMLAQLRKHNIKPNDSLKILEGQGILASIKICCDWLRSNHDIIRLCARSSKILLKRITILLNLININTDVILRDWDTNTIFVSSTEDLQRLVKLVPLPEDLDLRGVNILEDAQKSLNWKILHKCKMNKQMEILLRALKLIEFGHYLSSTKDSGIKYDVDNKLFVTINTNVSSAIKGDNLDGKDLEANHSKGKLMRHMGRLWLKAEVRALETRLRSRLMSPYLVPDHEALAKHTPALKRLVYAKKFIVVIPTVGKNSLMYTLIK